MAMMKVKKDTGMSTVGKIITAIFIILLIAAVYYFVTLFKGVDIDAAHLAGEWKQAGSPTTYYTFSADGNSDAGYDGTLRTYEQFTTGEIRNEMDYYFYLKENENGVMVLHLLKKDKTMEEVEQIKITKLSSAEISIIRNGSEFETITKVKLF